MHMSNESFRVKGKLPITEKLPESIESSKFVSYKTRTLGEFDLSKEDG